MYHIARCKPAAEFSDADLPEQRRHNLGLRAEECEHCHALMWAEEATGTGRNKGFSMCCRKGKVDLHHIFSEEPPEELATLLGLGRELSADEADTAKHFKENIRSYNSGLQMASSTIQVCVFNLHFNSKRCNATSPAYVTSFLFMQVEHDRPGVSMMRVRGSVLP